MYELILLIWELEEILLEWKESLIISIHTKGDRNATNNYHGISLLISVYKIVSNIFLARLTTYANEITGEYWETVKWRYVIIQMKTYRNTYRNILTEIEKVL